MPSGARVVEVVDVEDDVDVEATDGLGSAAVSAGAKPSDSPADDEQAAPKTTEQTSNTRATGRMVNLHVGK
jgi:hypothetical protein